MFFAGSNNQIAPPCTFSLKYQKPSFVLSKEAKPLGWLHIAVWNRVLASLDTAELSLRLQTVLVSQ